MERARLKPKVESNGGSTKGLYFTSGRSHLEFISTGCTLLDCALGGGFVLGRIENLIGDKSTCKTLIASETATNFILRFPNGKAFYRESEAAYDREYAKELGFPVDQIDFGEDVDFYTVEDFERDLSTQVDLITKEKIPGLYVVDSLDALSDEAELARDIGEGSYGANKAKQLSTLFRKHNQKLENSRMCSLIISQERDNIGVSFGNKSTRSGGRALSFYSTHVIWLARVGAIKKTIKGVERPVGVTIKAKVEKNKVGLEGRIVEFDFLFGFGIDNFTSNLDWIKDVRRFDVLGLDNDKDLKQYHKLVSGMTDENYWEEVKKVDEIVVKLWYEIEQDFIPVRRKYNVA